MNLWKRKKTLPDKPARKPALHFAGWGFDDREDADTYRDEGDNVVVVEAAGQAFILRKMESYIFFRREDDGDERAGLYLPERYSSRWKDDIKQFPPEKFIEAYTKQAYGRCLVYVAEAMQPHQCAYLCFAPDGTGFGLDYTEERLVDFRWQDVTEMAWPQVLAADPESLRPLCQTVFDTLVHPRLTNPYIDPDSLQEIPHEFVCGSEEDLRRLTTIIVQSEPALFDTTTVPVSVVYRARTPTKRAYMMKVQRSEQGSYYAETVTENLGRLQALCDLALRLNTFTGVKWETWMDNPNRLGHFQKQVQQVVVHVQPPSAHERAESLLMLADWLEGKVREEKRLRLCGV